MRRNAACSVGTIRRSSGQPARVLMNGEEVRKQKGSSIMRIQFSTLSSGRFADAQMPVASEAVSKTRSCVWQVERGCAPKLECCGQVTEASSGQNQRQRADKPPRGRCISMRRRKRRWDGRSAKKGKGDGQQTENRAERRRRSQWRAAGSSAVVDVLATKHTRDKRRHNGRPLKHTLKEASQGGVGKREGGHGIKTRQTIRDKKKVMAAWPRFN